jgi:hypothetical protein
VISRSSDSASILSPPERTFFHAIACSTEATVN